MKRLAVVGALLAATVPAFAQEIALFGTSAFRGSEPLRHGAGISLAGSFRLGDILVDTSLARRANVHVGARVSISEARFGAQAWGLCIDFCPPGANDLSIVARTTKTTLTVLPVANSTTRLELNVGVASYRQDRHSVAYGNSWRTSEWGFVVGVAASRRFGASPFWLHLAYTRHSDFAELADGDRHGVPKHSVVAGLMLRVANWRER